MILKGLIDFAPSPEMLSGVLAHEIAHVSHRHVLQSVMRGTLIVALIGFITGDMSGMLIMDPGTAGQLLSLSFSRGMENQADRDVLERLGATGVGIGGLRDFFENGQKQDVLKNLAFLSTHPRGENRLRLLKASTLPLESKSELLTAEEFKAIRRICSR